MQKQTSSEITFYSLNIIHRAKEIEMDFIFFSEATEGVSPKDVIWPKQGEQGCFILAFKIALPAFRHTPFPPQGPLLASAGYKHTS